jgi:hypothetical protein
MRSILTITLDGTSAANRNAAEGDWDATIHALEYTAQQLKTARHEARANPAGIVCLPGLAPMTREQREVHAAHEDVPPDTAA